MGHNALERFMSRVDVGPGCWLWRGTTNSSGHGRFKIRTNVLVQAHRFVWEQLVGPIPDQLCVLHRCDVPNCVNPDHLFLGTQADNINDMYAKRRRRGPRINDCHPGQKHIAKGLCRTCYGRLWRSQHGAPWGGMKG